MAHIYLLLGSNLGDRHRNIDRAICLLNEYFGSCPLQSSGRITTKAVGFDGYDFINCIVVYDTEEDPQDILTCCKGIEERIGRKDKPEYDAKGNRIYHNRLIDIDILIYGDLRISTPSLTIPHPQVETRAFVRELLDTLSK